jgi:hypothetical protein
MVWSKIHEVNVTIINLVPTIYILQDFFVYAFYKTRGLSWILSCDFNEKDKEVLGATEI